VELGTSGIKEVGEPMMHLDGRADDRALKSLILQVEVGDSVMMLPENLGIDAL
jgi:hypothetical protein